MLVFPRSPYERAIGMVLESQGKYDSQWAAICSIAPKIDCTPETLRVWVRQHEQDAEAVMAGSPPAEREASEGAGT